MELIPHDELRPSYHFHFAPMIDFLFLMLSLFATLAISRMVLYDAEVDLVEIQATKSHHATKLQRESQQIHLSLDSLAHYKWISEFQEYPMADLATIREEISRQYQIGALPQDKSKTEILLHIDQKTPWGPIARTIFAIRELGFSVYPVFAERSTEESVP
jgi:biopolymer transport protein ExbD